MIASMPWFGFVDFMTGGLLAISLLLWVLWGTFKYAMTLGRFVKYTVQEYADMTAWVKAGRPKWSDIGGHHYKMVPTDDQK